MNELLENLMMLQESSIDFPREDLDPQVWEKTGDGYTLQQEVKDKIRLMIDKYGPEDLEEVADKIRIVGSICSNQYTESTDIDVHIIPQVPRDWPEERVKEVKKFFDADPEYVGDHPIEIYVQVNPDQDLVSIGAYDLLNNDWEVGPTLMPENFNPYEFYHHLADEVESRVEKADELLAELKRDTIDYDTMVGAMSRLDGNAKNQLHAFLQTKSEEIENDIQELYVERKKWTDARQKSSSGKSVPDKEWKEENATFKFLDRYNYLKLLGDLNKLIEEDGTVDQDDVGVIATKLGIDRE